MNEMETARLNMVESQVRPSDVVDRGILRVMSEIPREVFVPGSMRTMAYMDEDILIKPGEADGLNRYLMAPRVFARLIQLAEINKNDVVLNVGCGSGYSIAVLARLCESVIGLETDEELANQAEKNLSSLHIDNGVIIRGSLEKGYPDEGPYDAIIVEGAIQKSPETLLEQLKDMGRLVAVVAENGFGKAVVFKRTLNEVSNRQAFDAAAPKLPGFEKEKEFIF